MTYLTYQNEDNITFSPEDGGCIINDSDSIVLLRKPGSMKELLRLFHDFDARLRKMIFKLLSSPYGELQTAFGNLNHNVEHTQRRSDTLYGLLSIQHDISKYTNLKKSALVHSMVDLGMVNPLTPHGKKRQRLIRGEGSIVDIIDARPQEDQVKIIANLVDNYDPDDYLLLGQTSTIGLTKLRDYLFSMKDPLMALHQIADWAWVDAYNPVPKADRESHAKGSDHEYASVWFAQYLATRGILLFPLTYASVVRRSYPSKFLPILCWMSVPDYCADIAENISSLERGGSTSKTTVNMCLNAFLGSSFASDMWSSRRFCPAPLVKLKEGVAHEMLSASANHVYRYLVTLFGADSGRRAEGPAFEDSKRLDSEGWGGFEWCRKPRPGNTKKLQKILGHPVDSVPPHVQKWAREMTPLLALFGVKHVKVVIDSLNVWLWFLMTLDPDHAPHSFADINRQKHINDLNPNSSTFVNFLEKHYSKSRAEFGRRAVSKISSAWEYKAILNGFQGVLPNPFDVKNDGPVVPHGQKEQRFATSRTPMEFAVFFLILSENRKNFYEFARSNPKYTRRLRNPKNGLMEDVFWPLEALLLDVILSTGSRGMDARWLDSAEGDEKHVDVDHLREVDNMLSTATPDRKAGFVRLIPINGERGVLGMFRSSNKTGNLEEVPYMDEELARNFQTFVALQTLYNPITKPVRLVDQRNYSPFARMEAFDWVYPAFREVGKRSNAAVSRERMWSYWKALLRHCQPLVDELLGFHYPLMRGNEAVFDIHSLRVTLVTFLIDEGVNPDFVRRIVGHKSLIMTWYYHGLRTKALHENVRKAMDRLKSIVDKAASGDKAALLEIVDAAYVDPKANLKNVGVERLRTMAEWDDPVTFESFDHGICADGKCEDGNGNDRPVWRKRACSSCIFRVTGPHFFKGLMARTNSLMFEIKNSLAQSADYNRSIEELEDATGETQHALRLNVLTLDRDREHLCLEWAIEAKTTMAIEMQIMEMLDSEADRSDSRGKEVAEAGEQAKSLLNLAEEDDFLLYYTLARDCQKEPLSQLHFPRERIREFAGKITRFALVNDLGDLLYKIPASDKTEQLIKFAGLAIEQVGGSKLREFIALSDELEVSPELANADLRKVLSRKIDQKVLQHAV